MRNERAGGAFVEPNKGRFDGSTSKYYQKNGKGDLNHVPSRFSEIGPQQGLAILDQPGNGLLGAGLYKF
ncbi:MAG TPA: hypothetical protein VF730_00740, partial [Terracidiphilus sp.]